MGIDKRSPGKGNATRTTVAVAVLALAGTIGAAVLTNYDKIFPKSPAHTSGYPAGMIPLEPDTDRFGSDIRNSGDWVASAEVCAWLCAEKKECKSMTFAASATGLKGGNCWLKDSVAKAYPRAGAISAFKKAN
jgi:hypothetical protein